MEIKFTLTHPEIVGILLGIASLLFNVYFLLEKKKAKKQKNELHDDLEIVSNMIDEIIQSINSTEYYNRQNLIHQLSSQMNNLYTLVSGNLKKYKIRGALMKFKFFKTREEVSGAMLSTIRNSDEYILTIGGQTRETEYVDNIEKKIKNNEIRYMRLITGDHIRDVLYDHLIRIIGKQNVKLKYLGTEDKYGGIIVTKGKVFLALKTNETNLTYGIIIKEQNISEEYRSYVEGLSTCEAAQEVTKDLCDRLLKKYIETVENEDRKKYDELNRKYSTILQGAD